MGKWGDFFEGLFVRLFGYFDINVALSVTRHW